MISKNVVEPNYGHLLALGTSLGIHEHAKGNEADPEHGYCLDDVGRLLAVVAREPDPDTRLLELGRICLSFADQAVRADGSAHNRMSASGRWTDQPFVGDHWGRVTWGLGQLVGTHQAPKELAEGARTVLDRSLRARSRWPRAMAHAAVGAADALAVRPGNRRALALLLATRPLLEAVPPNPSATAGTPAGAIRAVGATMEERALAGHSAAGGALGPPGNAWPEPRLTYANALIPEALIAIGVALDDKVALDRGLSLLEWLIQLQTRDGRLSPVPTQGWAPGEPLPAFDQQPIEVSSLAEASWRALQATGDPRWVVPLWQARDWFLGVNDSDLPLYDAATGSGHDGLTADGRNANQGAESTIAAVSTLQLARLAERWLIGSGAQESAASALER